MMRRWSSSSCTEHYDDDIEHDSCQNLRNEVDVDEDFGRRGLVGSSSSSSCLAINNDPGSRSMGWTSSYDDEPPSRSVPWSSREPDQQPGGSISLQMAIWRELYAGQQDAADEPHQDSALVWRRNFHQDPAEEESQMQHEERRIAERFATFPKGRAAVLSSGGGGSSSGGSTPKSRRRNKRKGCDSPRPVPDDNPDVESSNAKSPVREDALPAHNQEETMDCGEPLTSHGMRPARPVWASLELFSDFEEDAATLSPRVLSPEMDEPAGSHHVRRFGGRCIIREPQEKRTTFVALGSLNDRRLVVGREPDEAPTALRAKQLVQQIYGLKEKVKLYEDAFEQRHGYRPSHHQKMDDRTTKRFLTELAKARKELKQLKERHQPVLMESSSATDPAGSETAIETGNVAMFASVEQTVVEVQEHLVANRQLAGRPEALEELTAKQVLDEKAAVQRALLYVESLHGRPTSYGHKDLLRPLYDRYRLLKRMVVRSGLSRSKEEMCDLAPILEYETLDLNGPDTWAAAGNGRHSAPPTPSLEEASRSIRAPVSNLISGLALDVEPQAGKRPPLDIEENLHALPLNQLVEQLRTAREEKKRLRRAIRDLEADLLRQHHHQSRGSSSSHPVGTMDGEEEQLTMEPVYSQYRHARAKLRLLEALVAKHDGSATL